MPSSSGNFRPRRNLKSNHVSFSFNSAMTRYEGGDSIPRASCIVEVNALSVESSRPLLVDVTYTKQQPSVPPVGSNHSGTIFQIVTVCLLSNYNSQNSASPT